MSFLKKHKLRIIYYLLYVPLFYLSIKLFTLFFTGYDGHSMMMLFTFFMAPISLVLLWSFYPLFIWTHKTILKKLILFIICCCFAFILMNVIGSILFFIISAFQLSDHSISIAFILLCSAYSALISFEIATKLLFNTYDKKLVVKLYDRVNKDD